MTLWERMRIHGGFVRICETLGEDSQGFVETLGEDL